MDRLRAPDLNEEFSAALRRMSVLVIDENRYARKLLCDTLRAVGVGGVQSAASVNEAVERMRFFQPQVVMLEWQLRFLDGMELTRLIRDGSAPLPRDTALVLVTGRSTRSDVETARRWGVDEYLVKPFTTRELARRLRAVVLNRRPFVEAATYVGPCRRRRLFATVGGPARRMLDGEAEAFVGPDFESRKARMLERIAQGRQIVSELAPADFKAMRALFRLAKELEAEAVDVAEPLICQAAGSLGQYLAGVGAGPHLDVKVIKAHLEAAERLLLLPFAERALREEVAAELARLVRCKLSRTRFA